MYACLSYCHVKAMFFQCLSKAVPFSYLGKLEHRVILLGLNDVAEIIMYRYNP